MMHIRRDYNELDNDDFQEDDYIDDYEDDLDELDFLDEDDSSLDEDDIEISLEIDADGREVYYAEDAKIPNSHSQGYSAEEAIEGLEQRRREYREIRRRSRESSYDGDEPDEIPDPDSFKDDDGVHISMEIDEDGNERWYATDPKVPGSASMGLSAEEAVDGLEERRSEFREMLKRSRAQSKRKHGEG